MQTAGGRAAACAR